MPTTTRTPRTKCYLHEMRHPLELPYEPHKYHICWICQTRLLEMAKSKFHFALRDQMITISMQPAIRKEPV
jgi:hypothetical protein